MPISDSFLQELRVKNDINDIISGYVSLKKGAQLILDYVRFIMKKRRRLQFIPIRSPFTASAAAQAVTP